VRLDLKLRYLFFTKTESAKDSLLSDLNAAVTSLPSSIFADETVWKLPYREAIEKIKEQFIRSRSKSIQS